MARRMYRFESGAHYLHEIERHDFWSKYCRSSGMASILACEVR